MARFHPPFRGTPVKRRSPIVPEGLPSASLDGQLARIGRPPPISSTSRPARANRSPWNLRGKLGTSPSVARAAIDRRRPGCADGKHDRFRFGIAQEPMRCTTVARAQVYSLDHLPFRPGWQHLPGARFRPEGHDDQREEVKWISSVELELESLYLRQGVAASSPSHHDPWNCLTRARRPTESGRFKVGSYVTNVRAGTPSFPTYLPNQVGSGMVRRSPRRVPSG